MFKIFFTFFKIGLFTFGGGYSMIPLIHFYAVDKFKWISETEFIDIIAIAESTPGPIAINSATYVGYKYNGVKGSAFATLGVALPSIIIIVLISAFLMQFKDNTYVEYCGMVTYYDVIARNKYRKALDEKANMCFDNGWNFIHILPDNMKNIKQDIINIFGGK